MSQKYDFSICGNVFCAFEYLEGHFLAIYANGLCEFAIHECKFFKAYILSVECTSRFGDFIYSGIYLLKSCSCHTMYLLIVLFFFDFFALALYELLCFGEVFLEVASLKFGVVHLLEQVDELLEEVCHFFKIVKGEVLGTYSHN